MGGLRDKIPFTYVDDADRHAGADRLPAHRRLFLQGRDHRGGLRRHRPGGDLRLRADAGRRRADLVLLLAADVHDLPRQAARRARRTATHAHETPAGSMLVPLVVLAARRASSPGLPFAQHLHRRRARAASGASSLDQPPSAILRDDAPRAVAGSSFLPTVADGASASPSPGISTSADPRCPVELAARAAGCSTASCSTSGTSTSSTTSSSCGRPCGSAASCGRAATAGSSTASARRRLGARASTSPAAWSGCRPATSTTTPSPC